MAPHILAWYTCAVFSLACALLLFATVAPGAERRIGAWQVTFGVVALVFAAIGRTLTNLPSGHRLNRSVGVRCGLIVAAVFATMLLAMSVG